MKWSSTFILIVCAALPFRFLHAAVVASTTQATTQPDASYRSPQETIQSIVLPPNYHLELVAAEPEIIAPVNISWDGNGRMYVAQMRSYMRDIDDTNAKEPISCVTRFDDMTPEGHYATHTVFVDKLVLPRMVLPLDDRVLIRETDTRDIYCYR